MPVKPLPRALVDRITRIIARKEKAGKRRDVYRLLGRLKNVDPRRARLHRPTETADWGGRIRQLDASRNFPGEEFVLKRTHLVPAKRKLETIKSIVSRHNERFRPKRYILQEPIAYAVGRDIILMAKADKPSMNEIIAEPGYSTKKTERGTQFVESMKTGRFKRKRSKREKLLMNAWKELQKNWDQTGGRWGASPGNFLVVDYKEGKFIFVPLMDLMPR